MHNFVEVWLHNNLDAIWHSKSIPPKPMVKIHHENLWNDVKHYPCKFGADITCTCIKFDLAKNLRTCSIYFDRKLPNATSSK